MSAPMKGLVQFIADLRNARAREAEVKRVNMELANIRQKFRDSNLSGYNKKKYVCKLIYMYILGYEIDFGHQESVSLISSSKYSEKQIGYLAVSLMLNENSSLLDMVINSMRKDLGSLNDLDTCLALNCIATVGNKTMSYALADDVFKLFISPTSPPFVRKKAALTILRLYRKNPEIIDAAWPDRIVALLDDPDLGVATSVSSLVVALAQDDPERLKMSYNVVVRRLYGLVFQQSYSPDYVYYQVPCPWLFIKLFKLLQYYPPPSDEMIRDLLNKVIVKVIEQNAVPVKNIQQNNAQNAVLFEVINIAIHVDVNPQLLERIVEALGQFLQSPETNVRYLTLNAMAHLAARYDQAPVKKYLVTVMKSLKDRDISIRRKAIDLLYCLCDSTNVKTIVQELIKYLQAADFAIREEMVIRIAILVEKFATEFKWYVDISLRLLAVAGNHVSDEVWQRVVQIVVNNESLQPYAARTVMNYLRYPNCHENMVKVGGYILGEYGHLIADEPDCSPVEQFLALHDKFTTCSTFTKGLLLTTYIKFVNLFAEIRPQLLQVFEFYSTSIESEIQQRACEYLRIANSSNSALLPTVWDEMPPFPERTSALLTRLHSKHAHSEDKRVWALGNKDAQNDRAVLNLDVSGPAKRLNESLKREEQQQQQQPQLQHNGSSPALSESNYVNNSSSSSSLASATALAGAPPPPPPRKASGSQPSSQEMLTSGWEKGYKSLLRRSEGIFYEDSLIQIGLRSEYRKHLGCVILYFRNTTTAPLQSLAVELVNPAGDDVLQVSTKNFPDSTLAPKQSTQQVIIIDAKQPFAESPQVKITYMAGTLKVLQLKLPVILDKFMDAAPLSGEDFFKRWKQLTAENLEVQKIFKNHGIKETDRAIVESLNYGAIPGVDKNENNVVAASVLHTSQGGNFGCLMRLEPNSSKVMYRVTVRATDERVPQILVKNLTSLYQP
ncbi:AP-2 complex subunit alpha [Trichomonascus vanleenenianus]|uniref:Apl3p n=1 Tax=Trichomonascus vanleenenianus TaxID=2268995 RepID=UPI003EC95371